MARRYNSHLTCIRDHYNILYKEYVHIVLAILHCHLIYSLQTYTHLHAAISDKIYPNTCIPATRVDASTVISYTYHDQRLTLQSPCSYTI